MNMTRDALRRQVLAKQAKDGNLNDPEPDPVKNEQPPVWPWVIEQFKILINGHNGYDDKVAMYVTNDMAERHLTGIEKYGVPLQPHNGRNALVDAYQEALDLCAYLGQDALENGYDMASGFLVDAMKLAQKIRNEIEEL